VCYRERPQRLHSHRHVHVTCYVQPSIVSSPEKDCLILRHSIRQRRSGASLDLPILTTLHHHADNPLSALELHPSHQQKRLRRKQPHRLAATCLSSVAIVRRTPKPLFPINHQVSYPQRRRLLQISKSVQALFNNELRPLATSPRPPLYTTSRSLNAQRHVELRVLSCTLLLTRPPRPAA
jgi:hypothetical protein